MLALVRTELYYSYQHVVNEIHGCNFIENTHNACSLDNLLIQLRSEVTPYWYQFGTVIGVNEETLKEYSSYPPEECIVEVLDYWLIHHPSKPTWKDVAIVLKEIKLHQLAENILKVYETGKFTYYNKVVTDMELYHRKATN